MVVVVRNTTLGRSQLCKALKKMRDWVPKKEVSKKKG
jgi:hypothetical protein